MKVETSVLGSLSLTVLMDLSESRGGLPRLQVPNSPYGLCGRKATLKLIFVLFLFVSCVLFLLLFCLELSSAGRSHNGSLFTDEERKRTGLRHI